MIRRRLFILAFSCLQCLYSEAQSYIEKYDSCSRQLDLVGTKIDSLYFVHLEERNICLVGSIAPYFSATSINGRHFSSNSLKGKVIVLNFWFTRCQPCIEEIPMLNRLASLYLKDVAFISFAPESPEKLQIFLKKHPFTFNNVAKSDNIRRDVFKLFSIWPYTIIIDRKGKISKMFLSNADAKTFDIYRKAIDKAL